MKNKVFLTPFFVLFAVLLLPACGSSRSAESLFRKYASKPGFHLTKSDSDLHFDFARDKELVKYINGIRYFYTLNFDADSGSRDDYAKFVKKLNKIVSGDDFHLILEIKTGGRMAAWYRQNKNGDIDGILISREGKSSAVWIWAPSDETKEEQD